MKVYEKDLKLSKNQNAKRPGVEIDLEKLWTYLKKKNTFKQSDTQTGFPGVEVSRKTLLIQGFDHFTRAA